MLYVILSSMSTTRKRHTVLFRAKGQVVIPAWLRKEFQIGVGSKALVQATPDGILLKPVTRHTIAKLHGILERKPGEKPLAEEWAEYRREEKELEDRGHGRHGS
jgi:AbrB family looped-hinge helix DNA binding protein